MGAYRLSSLTPLIIQEYVNKKFISGLKKNSIESIISVLRASLKYAVVPAKLLQSSPAEYITYPKLNYARSETIRTIISIEDFKQILQRFPKGNPFRYSILIGYYTGLRIGEVYALTWDDIDLDNGYINVSKGIYKRNNGLHIKKANLMERKEETSAWYFGDTKTFASIRKIKRH